MGAFLFIEDVHNYLGYVQQAETGAFRFRSKLTNEPHAAVLVNLEWWATGRLSRALGRRPLLAFRLLGVVAAVAFVALADAWLRRAGLPGRHRLPALLLACWGAGLGGLLSALGLTRTTPLDLYTGLFPALELLANPHFVVGTSLVMASLLALALGSARATAAGVLLAAAAGLTRPYDLALIVAARTLAVAATEPPRQWARRLLPLAGVLPVAGYMYWVVHRHRAFSAFVAERFPPPPLAAVILALGPALALAALSLRGNRAEDGPEARRLRAHLWAWIAVGLLLVTWRPVPYALQFLAGIGFPLLALAAVGLARFPPAATLGALALLASTTVAALGRMGDHARPGFVPTATLAAARALRPVCGPGDLLLAPPDVGLITLAYSSCTPYVSHPAMGGYEARVAAVRAFYGGGDAQRRAAFLAQVCPAVLVLPAGAEGFAFHRRAGACTGGDSGFPTALLASAGVTGAAAGAGAGR